MVSPELKKVVLFICEAGTAVAKAEADGSINLLDVPLFLKLLPDLFGAMNSLSAIPKSLQEITKEEADDLANFVTQNLGIGNDKALVLIETAIKAAYSNYDLYKAIKVAKAS